MDQAVGPAESSCRGCSSVPLDVPGFATEPANQQPFLLEEDPEPASHQARSTAQEHALIGRSRARRFVQDSFTGAKAS